LRARLVASSLLAGLIVLALALPAVAVAAERTLTVNFAGEGEGEVECEVEGGGPELCEDTYPSGTELTLVAEAEFGSEFAGFSAGTGSAAGCTGTAPCSFTIAVNSAVTATFDLEPLPEFTLTVNKAGTGSGTVECEVEGEDPEPCAAKYREGTELILIATPSPGSEFVHWSGACADAEELEECELTMEGNRSATATFNLWPALTVHTAGAGSGSVTCEAQEGEEACAAAYPKGTELILRAKPGPGSEFAGWSGSCKAAGAEEECELTMEGSRSLTATFDLLEPEQPDEPEGGQTAPSSKPTQPPPPRTAAAAGTATAAATATVSGGKAPLKLTCTGGPCSGSLTLTAKVKQGKKTKNLTIGKASFSLADGATATVKVKLSGPAKQELAKGKTVKAKLSGTGVTARTVKLKPRRA